VGERRVWMMILSTKCGDGVGGNALYSKMSGRCLMVFPFSRNTKSGLIIPPT